MGLVICGDIHGKHDKFFEVINSIPKTDQIIQIGDVGFGFGQVPRYPDNVEVFRGNHDDPEVAKKHPNYLGDYGYIEKHNLFWMAGAWSIDWGWRKAHYMQGGQKIWWEDEELSQPELDAALALYTEVKPSIMLSHEAPASIVPHVLAKVTLDLSNSPMVNPKWEKIRDESAYNRPEKLECIYTRTSAILQKMLEAHAPKHWIFGHYHLQKDIFIKPTQFHCCEELGLYRIPPESEPPNASTYSYSDLGGYERY